MRHIGSVFGKGAPLSEGMGTDGFPRYIGDRLILDFHEGAGTTVRDLSGNGNDGTFKAAGEPAWEKDRVHFDASNDYIDCGNDTSLLLGAATEPFSVFVQCKIDTGQAFAADLYVLCLVNRYALRTNANPPKWNGFVWGIAASGRTTVTTEVWYHSGLIHDGTNEEIWLNGTSDGTASGTSTANGTNSLQIGARAGATVWDGIISFVRINATTFSAPQVLQEYLWNKWRN